MNIILDKSTFQSLAYYETITLSRHFKQNLTPILALEVLGDLAKEPRGEKTPEDKLTELSKKFGGSGPTVNMNYRDACINSLLGNKIPMTGQIIIDYGQPVKDSEGRTGVFIGLSSYNEAILRWVGGEFVDEEYGMSEEWRNITRSLSLEDFSKIFEEEYIIVPSINLLEELPGVAHSLLNKLSMQDVWLNWIIDKLDVPTHIQFQIHKRWESRTSTYLSDFAPYAYHCIQVLLFLFIAVKNQLVKWKSTNLLDANYLYYLPFCNVFSSNDKLHRKLAPLLMRDDQDFVTGERLKKDLRQIKSDWEALPEDKHRRLRYALASYPIPSEDSIIVDLYKRHCLPWDPTMVNRAIKLSPEEQKLALKEAKELLEGAGLLNDNYYFGHLS